MAGATLTLPPWLLLKALPRLMWLTGPKPLRWLSPMVRMKLVGESFAAEGMEERIVRDGVAGMSPTEESASVSGAWVVPPSDVRETNFTTPPSALAGQGAPATQAAALTAPVLAVPLVAPTGCCCCCFSCCSCCSWSCSCATLVALEPLTGFRSSRPILPPTQPPTLPVPLVGASLALPPPGTRKLPPVESTEALWLLCSVLACRSAAMSNLFVALSVVSVPARLT